MSETSRMADRDVKKLEKRRTVIERDMRTLQGGGGDDVSVKTMTTTIATTATTASNTTTTISATEIAATATATTKEGVKTSHEENQRLLMEMSQKIVTGDGDMATHQQVGYFHSDCYLYLTLPNTNQP